MSELLRRLINYVNSRRPLTLTDSSKLVEDYAPMSWSERKELTCAPRSSWVWLASGRATVATERGWVLVR